MRSVIFKGRDASGKDGTIKRVVEQLSPREIRIVALGRPSDKDTASWYFQRYVHHLPAAHEVALFNRSWYDRAGVEKVIRFGRTSESARVNVRHHLCAVRIAENWRSLSNALTWVNVHTGGADRISSCKACYPELVLEMAGEHKGIFACAKTN